MSDRLSTGWALALLVLGVAAVILLGRRLSGAEAPKRQALPSPATDDNEEDEEAEPICRARGCSALATRGLPEARPWRPLSWLLPRWQVVTDPEAPPAVCAAHHGPLAAALTARAAAERAALEEHLAARHRELVAWVLTQLQRDHGIAPPSAPRPSPLRAPTLAPPINGTAVDVIPAAEPPPDAPS